MKATIATGQHITVGGRLLGYQPVDARVVSIEGMGTRPPRLMVVLDELPLRPPVTAELNGRIRVELPYISSELGSLDSAEEGLITRTFKGVADLRAWAMTLPVDGRFTPSHLRAARAAV